MDYIKLKKEKTIAKYGPFLDQARGGLFTRKTRERLIGQKRPFGRNRRRNDFWYDRRNDVKSAIIDLKIFFEVAGPDNVHQVIDAESLRELLETILFSDRVDLMSKPDPRTALIANALIKTGFSFFTRNFPHKVTLSHTRTIEEALDLGDFLTSDYLNDPKFGDEGFYFGQWDRERREE